MAGRLVAPAHDRQSKPTKQKSRGEQGGSRVEGDLRHETSLAVIDVIDPDQQADKRDCMH